MSRSTTRGFGSAPFGAAAVIVAGFVMMAAACGGSSDDTVAAVDSAVGDQDRTSVDVALATTELRDAHTGEITNIGDTVTGDRAVLLWYWAPH